MTPLTSMSVEAYKIPTDAPESDGTAAWNATTLIVVEVKAGGKTGLGYTYCGRPAALAVGKLWEAIKETDAFDLPAARLQMERAVRNDGRSGIAACAMAGVESALWDLKAKLLDVPLAQLLGRCREAICIYGSGGFTSYDDDQLRRQLSNWVERDRCRFVKMKIGREPERDPHRIAVAKAAIGNAELFVDANGALSVKQALYLAERTLEAGIRWFEEPVTSDDPAALSLLRSRLPSSIELAAGEYIYTLDDARALLPVVDVLQADATRCGVLAFLSIDALCEAHHIDLSAHCAPALHCHLALAARRMRHVEWFYDHARIEAMLFDGAPVPKNGEIRPDLSRPGLGLAFKRQDAERFRIWSSA